MNDIEKNFQESLRHHEVTPPPAVWDQLSASLAQKREKKVVYWQVAAAAALLLLGTGTLIVLLRSEPAAKVVRQQERSPAPNSEKSVAALPDPTEMIDSVSVAAPSGTEQIASLMTSAQREKTVNERKQALPDEHRPADVRLRQSTETVAQSPSAQPEHNPEGHRIAALPPTVPAVTDPLLPTAPVPEIGLSAAAHPERSTTEELAAADPLPIAEAQRRTVTVIYKPGNHSPKATQADQDDKFLGKTLSFLEDVKKNGLAFSELRSAKSELIDNVFSRDRTNQQ